MEKFGCNLKSKFFVLTTFRAVAGYFVKVPVLVIVPKII